MSPRHFLTLNDLSSSEFRNIIQRACELKEMQADGIVYEPLKNRILAMVFEKASTRTRVSFEAGMAQLGGHALFLSPQDTQLGRGEPIEDTARVLARMADAIMVRTFAHEKIERMADASTVPVINALTDDYHPCQLLADMQTYFEHRGDIQGQSVCWVGDGNNMCNSFINAAALLDFELIVACPEGYEPMAELVKTNKDRVKIVRRPEEGVVGAALVATDVWASMGQEDERVRREKDLTGFEVTLELMALAKDNA
ncbi:MAG: ornithine carbamoyltransferase, partial [Gammaproteobacteria bacterium]